MIFQTAYDTSIGKMTDRRQVEKMLKEALIKDMSYMNTFGVQSLHNIHPVFITGAGLSEALIPFFSHPLLLEQQGKSYLFSDIRPFIRKLDEQSGPLTEASIKNITEFLFSKSRLVLSMAWLGNEQSQIKNSLAWAGTVYAYWLSDLISRRYGLDAKDQLIITIGSHYFYQSQFEKEVTEESLQRFAVHTAKVTKAPTSLIFDILDKMGPVTDLTSYCEGIKNAVQNVRLSDFNSGMLLSLIANSWYGHNSRDILPVALEHPPTWCAIVYASVTERSYKNFMIAKIAERFGKYGQSDDFVKNLAGLITQYTTAISTESIVIRDFNDD